MENDSNLELLKHFNYKLSIRSHRNNFHKSRHLEKLLKHTTKPLERKFLSCDICNHVFKVHIKDETEIVSFFKE